MTLEQVTLEDARALDATDPLAACRRAAWSHGLAADHLERRGNPWTAEDLADHLGERPGGSQDIEATRVRDAGTTF